MKNRWVYIAFAVLVLILVSFGNSKAQDGCTTTWVPNPNPPPPGSYDIVCTGGGSGEQPDPGNVPCTPGSTYTVHYYTHVEGGLCNHTWAIHDCDTGGVLAGGTEFNVACPAGSDPPEFPCLEFGGGPTGVYCDSKWQVSASVGFPEAYLDVRPYPASLVHWPTAARCGGQNSASGSGSLDYIPYGGGSEDTPIVGDWRNIVLRLTFSPAGPMYFNMPYANPGEMILDPGNNASTPTYFTWEVPSHPALGGWPLAGDIPGLAELPDNVLPDNIPMFVGSAKSPYKLFWQLTWEQYTSYEDDACEEGSGPLGYDCETEDGDDGHRVCISGGEEDDHDCITSAGGYGVWQQVTYYEWRPGGRGGEILPSDVANLPGYLAADLDGDGVADAYWNSNVTLRRMNDNDDVYDPEWEASWNWWGTVYWAVREGQGQIGWP